MEFQGRSLDCTATRIDVGTYLYWVGRFLVPQPCFQAFGLLEMGVGLGKRRLKQGAIQPGAHQRKTAKISALIFGIYRYMRSINRDQEFEQNKK